MHPIAIFVLLSVLCGDALAKARVDPLVQTNVGVIRGVEANDGDYTMFLGIPYAQVNESNPFGLSTRYPKFNDIFEANDDSALCPQLSSSRNLVGTLDCLRLNVYVPRTATSQNRLPVMVWIYGGRFAQGSFSRNLYGPKYLVRHDVILVTLNYRVGPYGFMCLDTPEVPGNQGLKDQLLALRWVKENIESFGGDVDRITLFGESVGSMSVDLHLYSEQEKLFHRVIMESGTSMLINFMKTADPTVPIKLAQEFGLITEDINRALSFISTLDPKWVISKASTVGQFVTCVEKKFNGIERIVSDYSVNRNVPKAKNMPILIGYNSNEWMSNYATANPNGLTDNIFNDELKGQFVFDKMGFKSFEEVVRHFYIGDEKIDANVMSSLADIGSDLKFNHPTERSIAKYLENGAEKVYYYVFSYNGGRNYIQRTNNYTVKGAVHADELGYLFDPSSWKEVPQPEDQLTLDRMTTMWTNFAKHGDPTPETSELLPVKWEPITKNSAYNYLNIDKEITLGKKPFHQRMSFWDLFYKVNEEFQRGYNGN